MSRWLIVTYPDVFHLAQVWSSVIDLYSHRLLLTHLTMSIKRCICECFKASIRLADSLWKRKKQVKSVESDAHNCVDNTLSLIVYRKVFVTATNQCNTENPSNEYHLKNWH